MFSFPRSCSPIYTTSVKSCEGLAVLTPSCGVALLNHLGTGIPMVLLLPPAGICDGVLPVNLRCDFTVLFKQSITEPQMNMCSIQMLYFCYHFRIRATTGLVPSWSTSSRSTCPVAKLTDGHRAHWWCWGSAWDRADVNWYHNAKCDSEEENYCLCSASMGKT